MATASVIDSLVIMLGLDPTGIQEGINDAESALSGQIQRINEQAEITPRVNPEEAKQGFNELVHIADGAIGQIINKLKGLTAAYFTFQGINNLAQQFLQGADSAAKMARSLGVNMEDLQAWSEAVKRSGGSAEGFRSSLQQMTADLTNMAIRGEGEQKAFYDKMGIAIKDATGNARSAIDVMTDLAGAFEKMDAHESMGIGRRLGMDSGMIQLLQGGKKGLEELIQREKELGVYTKRDSDIAEKFNDIMDDFRQSMRSVFSVVFRPVFEWLTKIADKATNFAMFLQKHETFLKAFFAIITAGLTTMLIPAFAKLTKTIMANPLAKFIAVCALVAVAIEDLVVWANGGKSAFGGLWKKIFGSKEKAKAAFETVKNALKTVKDEVIVAVKDFITNWGKVLLAVGGIVGIVKTVIGVVNAAKKAQMLYNAVCALNPYTRMAIFAIAAIELILFAINNLRKNWGAYSEYIGNKWQTLVNFISNIWNSLTGVFSSVADSVRSVWDNLFSWFTSKFEWIGDKLSSIRDFAGNVVDTITGTGSAATPAIHKGGTAANSTTTVDSNITVQNVNVQTQATDAKGIAGGIGTALKDDLGKKLVANAQTGVQQK